MKGKLVTELDTILQDLKNQNNQINLTLKTLKKVKSFDINQTRVSKSVIDYTVGQKTPKITKAQEHRFRKSKTIHRCTSCKIISHASQKENIEKSKQKQKSNGKKVKAFSILQAQRKSVIQKNRSPTRKSNITMRYIGALNAKKSKKL